MRDPRCALPPTGARRTPRRSTDSVLPRCAGISDRTPRTAFEMDEESALGLSLRQPRVPSACPVLCRLRSSRASRRRPSAQPGGTTTVILRSPRTARRREEAGCPRTGYRAVLLRLCNRGRAAYVGSFSISTKTSKISRKRKNGKRIAQKVVAGNVHGVVERHAGPRNYGTLTSVPKRGLHQERPCRICRMLRSRGAGLERADLAGTIGARLGQGVPTGEWSSPPAS